MTTFEPTIDRAGKEYWDDVWAQSESVTQRNVVKDEFDPTFRNHVNRRFAKYFGDTLKDLGIDAAGSSLLEVGCGNSKFLPYFNTRLGYKITGIDYSEIGCTAARHALASQNATGEIICADMFNPPADLLGRFEVVTSNGLVEHFENTTAVLTAIGRFLRPGGIALTSIPNLVGWLGMAQKIMDRQVYDAHFPISAEALAAATAAAGLDVLECDHFLFTNSGLITILSGSVRARKAKRWIMRPFHAASYALEWIERAGGRLPPNRFTSPYIICVARKPI
jgi:2-polyprenyl-3-methyl-5-hydroxy-6-metoxy-1,4-benzoquinol methylase